MSTHSLCLFDEVQDVLLEGLMDLVGAPLIPQTHWVNCPEEEINKSEWWDEILTFKSLTIIFVPSMVKPDWRFPEAENAWVRHALDTGADEVELDLVTWQLPVQRATVGQQNISASPWLKTHWGLMAPYRWTLGFLVKIDKGNGLLADGTKP